MEPKQGLKKETRRHYQGYFQDGEYHVEKFLGTEVYEYDSKGYFTLYQSENYDENGDVSCGIVAVRRCENGAFIFETYNLNGEHLGYDKYDEKWRLVESRHDQHQSWSYDTDGNMTEEYCEFSGGWWKIQYEYNSKGRVVKSIRSNQDAEVTVVHHHYSRDCFGNIVESVITEDGEFLESNVIDRLSDKVILSRNERVEGEWTAIQRCFKDDMQVMCTLWNSDDIVRSTQIKYFESCLDGDVIVEPLLNDDVSDADLKGWKCHITLRDLEYNDFEEKMYLW